MHLLLFEGGEGVHGITIFDQICLGISGKWLKRCGIPSPLGMGDLAFKHTVLRGKTIWKTIIWYKYVTR